jgi:GMP synthase (glutamine-hydrolysing)
MIGDIKVIVLQHIQCETLGTIADALGAAGIKANYVRSFDGDKIPSELGDFRGLVVMGGPMGVYEQDLYPFLREELQLIESALQHEKPILGVCLGSQLLATALGAMVKKNTSKEIGWYPVTLTPSGREDPLWSDAVPSFMGFHWHGDIFDLPRGAVSLASSALTACQAFRHARNAYGLLFHMEVTAEMIGGMVRTFEGELQQEGIDGRALIAAAGEHLAGLQRIGTSVYRGWADLVVSG